MDIKNKNSGFTLIELIFVIAIISVTITLGISYMSKLAERTKEKTASLQIQQILQAAMTYYVQNQKWPDNADTSNAGDFKDYIPAIDRLKTNPWGVNNYSWTADTSDANLFTVSTKVPDTNTAARLMASLPNAYNNDTAIVYAQIAIPGQAQGLSQGYIIKVGTLEQIDLSKDDLSKSGDTAVFPLTDNENTLLKHCTENGNTVKVMPYVRSYRMKADIITEQEVEGVGVDIYESTCDSGKYCIHYNVFGDQYSAKRYFLLDKVIIAYTVFCV
jgi:prepilin-type N-terminal cleavage/methylation domain-containing protein